ncbi:MAG: glycoside hydrolase family 43 protein [Muribaculaceae bacterium]|nr:glycoside hydrolase family 43 protein [Muribaculaceae bacterium]
MKNILLAALAVAATATAGTYTNPVIPGFYPDPSICRVDSDFYLVNSSFQFFPGVPLWHSRDLVNWEQIGNVLNRPSQLPLGEANAWLGIYAPTIRYNDGTFYMITTNVGPQAPAAGGNFFVTATDPAGPWSEPVWLEQGGIDPSLYFEDGKAYMTSNPDGAIWLCEIDPATGKQLTPSRAIWQGTGGRHPEAPHIYKKDGWYYLMIAEGGTELGHGVTIARSRDIYGPYTPDPSNPLLTNFRMAAQGSRIQGVGHADLVDAPDGSWWIVALGYRTIGNGVHTLGRETMLAPVRWDESAWPVVNADGTLDVNMNAPLLPQVPVDKPSGRIDFTRTRRLGHEWVYLRNPHINNYRLDPQGLTLTATPIGLDDSGSPTWTGIRQTQHVFDATTTLCLDPAAPAGTRAGITVYMDGGSHYDAAVESLGDGHQQAVCTLRLNAITHSFEPVGVRAGSKVTLRVEGEDDMYAFSVSTDGGRTWKPLGRANARYLATETAGGFTGMTIGLFATGPEAADATFKDFTYNTEKPEK